MMNDEVMKIGRKREKEKSLYTFKSFSLISNFSVIHQPQMSSRSANTEESEPPIPLCRFG